MSGSESAAIGPLPFDGSMIAPAIVLKAIEVKVADNSCAFRVHVFGCPGHIIREHALMDQRLACGLPPTHVQPFFNLED